jgi:hypothetical protein
VRSEQFEFRASTKRNGGPQESTAWLQFLGTNFREKPKIQRSSKLEARATGAGRDCQTQFSAFRQSPSPFPITRFQRARTMRRGRPSKLDGRFYDSPKKFASASGIRLFDLETSDLIALGKSVAFLKKRVTE